MAVWREVFGFDGGGFALWIGRYGGSGCGGQPCGVPA